MSDSSFDLGMPAPEPTGAADDGYRVLARKYRPQTFSALIGQDAMVQTLANAIRRDRIAHAFLLTGIRGTGKTSTARLIAKGLNCIGPDGTGGPTIDPCGICEPCRAITEGRHIDVVEMDAASHTGIDDVREIIEAVRYAAVSARYKIYIIDEVHMLSKQAFNGLLKTLEEPPPAVKFLFATTEVDKVPVTVLSRCQRFDLRRIPAELLAEHFTCVTKAEGARAEPDALRLIARAAEGSARDGLSILDQAIAHAASEGADGITADAVRAMLGLSDRSAIRLLLSAVIDGRSNDALDALRRQHELGADPADIVRGLLEAIHATMLAKLARAGDTDHSDEERAAYADWAVQLSHVALHRLWQMLLKGHDEVQRAVLPLQAAEMALLRVIHASALPDPGELARRLQSDTHAARAPAANADRHGDAPPAVPTDFRGLVEWLDGQGKRQWAQRLHDDARVATFKPGTIRIAAVRPLPAEMLRDLGTFLRQRFGMSWAVEMVAEGGAPTLREQDAAREDDARSAILATPIVAAAMQAFPEAELIGWTEPRRSSA